MVHHVPIYGNRSKDFNEEKNLKYFSFFNLFEAYVILIFSYLVLSFLNFFKNYEKYLFIQTLQYYK